MRTGKACAQAAHASMKVLLDRMQSVWKDEHVGYTERSLSLEKEGAFETWISGIFTKICVSVNSEVELLDIYTRALSAGLPATIIQDKGLTEFGGVPTYTAVAIGPAWEDEINPITGHLPLL